MKRLLAMAAASVIALITAVPVSAAESERAGFMDQRVAQVLADNPGGVRTGWNEVSWLEGDVVLTLANDAGIQAMASQKCTSGRICVHSGFSQGGSMVSLVGCGPHGVSVLGAPVKSVTNARSSGSVVAKNGSTVVKTVAAGATSNVTGTVTTVGCA